LIPKNDNKFDLKAFESVLKKCKFINNIIIRESIGSEETICQLIIKYCLNLKSIALNLDAISDQTLKLFANKFGNDLKSICFESKMPSIESEKFGSNDKLKSLLKLCPNLLASKNVKIIDFIDENNTFVPNLQEFSGLLSLKRIELNDELFDKYKNSLKTIELQVTEAIGKILLKNSFNRLSLLKNLEILRLDLSCNPETIQSFVQNMLQIGSECKAIKSLQLIVYTIDSQQFSQLLNNVQHFKQLKYLDISTKIMGLNILLFFKTCSPNSKALVECQELTHLKLESSYIDDNFFDDIHLSLPQLTHLNMKFDSEISDKSMNCLSKMQNLKVIDFKSADFSLITDSGIRNIINNCPKIKSIRFNRRPNITNETIDALIGLALKKPRIYFEHNLGEETIDSEEIEIKCYESLPNNLKVEFIGCDDIQMNRYKYYDSDTNDSNDSDSMPGLLTNEENESLPHLLPFDENQESGGNEGNHSMPGLLPNN
jgi:hypothetical protein